jgi:hypothetical protein
MVNAAFATHWGAAVEEITEDACAVAGKMAVEEDRGCAIVEVLLVQGF